MVVITTKKEDQEVFDALNNFKAKKIAIVSCGVCAALCQTGGTEGLAEWQKKLQDNGFEITAGIVSEDF
jgi:hypothetical protein